MSVLEVAASQYHADDLGGDTPSLSASLIHTLLTYSPAHARAAHPKLNPNLERDDASHYDIGTIAHALLLQGDADLCEVIDAPDWRTKAAKEARDEARVNGKVPLLAHQLDNVTALVEAVAAQLIGFNDSPPVLTEGKPEQTLVWEENGVLIRSRLDWLRDDYRAIDDVKTTSRSANPEGWSRSLFNFGGDIQAALYLRGVKAVTGADATFRWLVIETAAPYAMSVLTPGPDVLALADAKIDRALDIWADCLATDRWPAYPTRVCTVELPPWEEPRWMEREAREEAFA